MSRINLSLSSRVALQRAAFILLAGSAGVSGAVAQDVVVVPEITVSAQQVPIELDRSGSAVTVLKGDDLRARGISTVGEALRDVPGVSVSQTGSMGAVTQVRIRGSDANHVLVLIDDVPMNRIDAGDFDFADFGVEAVERIEVLRGPQSGLYGSNAQSGVISIVTKSGRGLAKPVTEIWGEYGSRNTTSYAASTRGSAGAFYGAFTVQNRQTDGYNIARTGPERDPHRSLTVTAKGGIDFTPYFNVEGAYRTVRRAVQYDQENFFPPTDPPVFDSYAFDRFQTDSGRVAATLKLLDDRWINRVSWSMLEDTYISDYGFPPPLFTNTGKRDKFEYRSSYSFDTSAFGGARHTASFLLDREGETFTQGTIYSARDRDGAAGEYLVDFASGLTVSGAVRKDWNTQFDDAETWRLTGNQRLEQIGVRVHGSAGTGVTNPSFNQQFGQFFNFIPNPALTPARSFGWDAGVEKSFFGNRATIDVTYFEADVTDQIVPGTTGGGLPTAVNAPGVSHRRGVETTGKIALTNWWSVAASHTYLNATRPDGTPEPRRPDNSASVSSTILFLNGRGQFSGTYRWNDTFEDRANLPAGGQTRVLMPAYDTVTAILSYDATKWSKIYVRAENLFDQRYEEIYSYRAPPLGVFAGMRVTLN